jgi:homoserine O-acetyltransferase
MAMQEQSVAAAGFDANDWIAQTWAYDRHNLGDTLVGGRAIFGGDHIKALRSIKARTLVMSGRLDLYNPVEEGIEAATEIPDGRYLLVPSMEGHVAASPSDLVVYQPDVSDFLLRVTDNWKNL